MEITSDLNGIKEGDTPFSPVYGVGVVLGVETSGRWPVHVVFKSIKYNVDKIERSYSIDGFENPTDKLPTLFRDKEHFKMAYLIVNDFKTKNPILHDDTRELEIVRAFINDALIELRKARRKFPSSDKLGYAFAEESGELIRALLNNFQIGNYETKMDIYVEAKQTVAMVFRLLLEGSSDLNWRGIENIKNKESHENNQL